MLPLDLQVFVPVLDFQSSYYIQPMKAQLLMDLEPEFVVKYAALWLRMVSRTPTECHKA
jgi:hypothetical protein